MRSSRLRRTAIRAFTGWWFGPPYTGSVSASFVVDVAQAQAYLARLAARPGPHVTLNHLCVAAVARVLAAHPSANTRLVGSTFLEQDHVGVAMPVNMLGHAAQASRELGIAVVDRVELMSLRVIAGSIQRTVRSERRGEIENPATALAFAALERIGPTLAAVGLGALDRAMHVPSIARLFYDFVPMTTMVTNPGSVFAGTRGVWVRGGALSIPNRLVHLGTVWGIAPVQDEVVPIDGVACVRPVLPVVLIFDHRLIDGVRAGLLIRDFSAILADPARTFGDDGERPGEPIA